MGNKLGRRKQTVDERYTKPQGLYIHKDVDHKKLRKLILEAKLAPCYPGDEECCRDNEECPICFLFYPSMNRSRCCAKGICTECFLQMKNPSSTRPTQCPFCKTSNYAVEFRGMKTKEEKGLEQIEEQRVIEAKIRIRQQELQDEEAQMQKKLESSSSNDVESAEGECDDSVMGALCWSPIENVESGSAPHLARHQCCSENSGFDFDLEDIMIMEAIWLSIQEREGDRSQARGSASLGQSAMDDVPASVALSDCAACSPSGGLAGAIASLAERQLLGVDSRDHAEARVSPPLQHPPPPLPVALALSFADSGAAEI